MTAGIFVYPGAYHRFVFGPDIGTTPSGTGTAMRTAARSTTTGMRGHSDARYFYQSIVDSHRGSTRSGHSSGRIGIALALACWHQPSTNLFSGSLSPVVASMYLFFTVVSVSPK